jgi:hypothetical protein
LARRRVVALEAVASLGGRPQCEVGLAAAAHHVATDDVVRGDPQVAVDDRHHDHAVGRGVLDDVVRDKVVAATRHGDAHPERGVRERLRRCIRVAVVVDVVAGITASCCGGPSSLSSVLGTIPARLSCQSLFTIARSPPALVPEIRGGVGRLHVGDHGMAQVASADGEAESGCPLA